MSGGKDNATSLPTAVVKPDRRVSLAWIVPAVAVLLAAWLAVSAWRQRGLTITVQLPDGHGLKVGDDVRFRGIAVGEVRDVRVSNDLGKVVVTAGLSSHADRLARAGSRFWVVRPELRLTGVEGLETLLGPRYLSVAPPGAGGDARRQREFVGLPAPPVVAAIDPDDLEIVLEAPRRGGLRPGAPVSYRQMRVGTVLSVGLASDGGAVEARLHIAKAYRNLVRRATRFWPAGGLRTDLTLSGLRVELDSLQDIIEGGVAFATPPLDDAGPAVRTGHRFALASKRDDEWLEWLPAVAVGNSLLPPGAPVPQPLRASIAWKQGFIIKGSRSRRGWVLQAADGLIGPADLLTMPEHGAPETVSLEVAGQTVPLDEERLDDRGVVARLDVRVSDVIWPDRLTRRLAAPEDCIAIGDPTAAPIPLAATRLTADDAGWSVDPAVTIDKAWHGASVLSRQDGRLLGILLVTEDAVRVAPVAE